MGSKQKRRSLSKEERIVAHVRALELRKAGADWPDIARVINEDLEKQHGPTRRLFTASNLRADVMQQLMFLERDSLSEYRVLELQRLDAMYLPMFQRATSPTKPDYKAAKVCLDIHAQRGVLMGFSRDMGAMLGDQPGQAQSALPMSGSPSDVYRDYGLARDLGVAAEVLDAEFAEVTEPKPDD